MPQLVGCSTHVYICRRYDLGVKFHGSSKRTVFLRRSAPYRPCEFTRSRKSVGVEHHVGAFHTHRAVLARDGEFVAQPQISSRQNNGTRHGPHGETLGVQFGCSGEGLPQKNIPHFFRQHVVRLACYGAAIMFNAQIPCSRAMSQRVLRFPRRHLNADRGSVIVHIFLGDSVRLHGAPSLARHLAHHRGRQQATPPHHPFQSTALPLYGISGKTPAGATHHYHKPQRQRQRGVVWRGVAWRGGRMASAQRIC
ncbi:hypothetical protein MOQ_006701 [Trypanosoma cruzi marinkellei]|uniref:Uncharacterized protein n=1 Tax=Trypanosoma cruzi marinkellei TaxID=85056 RepID=K2M3E3_TRYCR|nr:hypothetical protein MOQ_006701 [Trypanosoma cruzi marinkellei]